MHLNRGALLQLTRTGVVGGLAALAIIAAAVFFVSKRRQQGAAPSPSCRALPCTTAQPSPARCVLTAPSLAPYQRRIGLPASRLLADTAPAAPPAVKEPIAGAYEPGWSPEEMRADMRALEDGAEGLIAALRGNKAALGGRRRRWLLLVLVLAPAADAAAAGPCHCRLLPPPAPAPGSGYQPPAA
jgi:hypothetical protein